MKMQVHVRMQIQLCINAGLLMSTGFVSIKLVEMLWVATHQLAVIISPYYAYNTVMQLKMKKNVVALSQRPTLKCGKSGSGFVYLFEEKKIKK